MDPAISVYRRNGFAESSTRPPTLSMEGAVVMVRLRQRGQPIRVRLRCCGGNNYLTKVPAINGADQCPHAASTVSSPRKSARSTTDISAEHDRSAPRRVLWEAVAVPVIYERCGGHLDLDSGYLTAYSVRWSPRGSSPSSRPPTTAESASCVSPPGSSESDRPRSHRQHARRVDARAAQQIRRRRLVDDGHHAPCSSPGSWKRPLKIQPARTRSSARRFFAELDGRFDEASIRP